MGGNSTLTTEHVIHERHFERELVSKNYWLADLIRNQWTDELLIRSQLGQTEFKTLSNLGYQVCVLEMKSVNDEKSSIDMNHRLAMHYLDIVKTIFEQHSFRIFADVHQHQIVLLVFDLVSVKTRKEQLAKKEMLQSIVKKINRVINRDKCEELEIYMGISSSSKGFNHAYFCYEEASKSIFLKSLFKASIVFYDDLGAFQLLINLHEKGMLESYILRHLGLIIEEDQKKKSDLLKTLKVYLERDGSMQSVADELHIVRQSLYYRLEKIKELLGEDYMCMQNRLALQLAIQAYELVKHKAN